MKTEVFNLIILDESGSMSSLSKSTIDGCNETLNIIRSAQEKFAETQDHYVSIFCFQSDGSIPSRYLIKNAGIAGVKNIDFEDYKPWGGTPLYDAIGSTLTDLKMQVRNKELAIGNVTIITDGYENSSQQYTLHQVSKMIEQLKELGWSFNFIGANIDAAAVAKTMSIDNSLQFTASNEGVKEMYSTEGMARMNWAERVNSDMAFDEDPCLSKEEVLECKRRRLKSSSSSYFKK